MSDYHFLRLNVSSPLARLTLDRPPLNVINTAMMLELQAGLEAASEAQASVVVLDARGRAFCSGTDIGEHLPPHTPRLLSEFRKLIVQLLELPCPSVAVVRGDALGGGCELVSACDLVVAAESASFGQPEIKLGVFPPIASVLLPRLVGPRRAAELILTGEPISAAEAQTWGLVNRVAPAERLEHEAEQLIAQLTDKSGPALRLARRALTGSSAAAIAAELEAMETRYLEEVAPLPDAEEGLRAFLEKRKPRWEVSSQRNERPGAS